jgi:trigger factor
MRTTMQATVTDAGTLRKQLTVTYSQAEVEARREQVLKKLSGQVRLDGFRPGKSSKAMVAKRFGSAAVQQAREELADEGFNQALRQHQLKPIGPIANEALKAEEGLTVVVSFDVKPAIALPDPKSLTVTTGDVVVGDQDVQQALDGLCKRAGSMDALQAGETVAEDDSITLSGAVNVAGKEVRKLHDFHHLVGGYALLGKAPAEVITLFKDKGVGAQVTFTSTLPASFTPAEAAGKEAEVSVTIQAAQRQRPAKADADLAKRLGIDSIDALKERLREQLKSQKEQEQHQKQIGELTDALIAKVEIALPPKLLEASLKDNLEPRVKQAEQEGKPAAEIAKLTDEVKANVEKSLKRFLLLDAVAEAHQVQVTREDIDGQIQMAAMRAGRKPQDIADQLAKSGQVNQVVQEIREAKTLEVLLDKVLGREPVLAAAAAHGEAGHVHGPDCNH